MTDAMGQCCWEALGNDSVARVVCINRFNRSVVEFFQNFQIENIENNLTKTAEQIIEVTNDHQGSNNEVLQIASELIGQRNENDYS